MTYWPRKFAHARTDLQSRLSRLQMVFSGNCNFRVPIYNF